MRLRCTAAELFADAEIELAAALPAGDFRDRPAIVVWAGQIAAALACEHMGPRSAQGEWRRVAEHHGLTPDLRPALPKHQ